MVVQMTMTKFRTRKLLMSLAAASVFLAACGDAQEEVPEAIVDTTTTSLVATPLEPETTLPSVPPKNPNTAPETLVDKAILDLVTRTEVSPDDVTVVVAEAVTWPDGALGCPQPGMSYTQALVDGSRVHLFADGRLFIYHAGGDGEPFLCPSDDKDGGYDFVPPPGFDK